MRNNNAQKNSNQLSKPNSKPPPQFQQQQQQQQHKPDEVSFAIIYDNYLFLLYCQKINNLKSLSYKKKCFIKLNIVYQIDFYINQTCYNV